MAGAVKAAADTDYLPSYYNALLLLRNEGQARADGHAGVGAEGAGAADPRHDARALARRCAWARRLRRAGRRRSQGGHGLRRHRVPPVAAARNALLHARARVFLRDPAVRPAIEALVERGSSEWIRREAQELLTFLSNIDSNRSATGATARPSSASGSSAPASATASTVDDATEPLAPARLIPVFRVVGDGEVREVGVFEGVECPRGSVIFKVRLPSRLFRVTARAFDQVEFFSYRSEPPGQVACGARPKPERVYLTYRSTGAAPGTDGVAVAIELLPDDYTP